MYDVDGDNDDDNDGGGDDNDGKGDNNDGNDGQKIKINEFRISLSMIWNYKLYDVCAHLNLYLSLSVGVLLSGSFGYLSFLKLILNLFLFYFILF